MVPNLTVLSGTFCSYPIYKTCGTLCVCKWGGGHVWEKWLTFVDCKGNPVCMKNHASRTTEFNSSACH
eukprot:1579725-Amphidinium_carterae.1